MDGAQHQLRQGVLSRNGRDGSRSAQSELSRGHLNRRVAGAIEYSIHHRPKHLETTVTESEEEFAHVADVVVVGAGGAGLPAAISARDAGASVIVVDEHYDVGGHAILSGGRVSLGGGTVLQQKFGISDSADRVYLDYTNPSSPHFRRSDRDIVRVFADENVDTFDFLTENGVVFEEVDPIDINGGSRPRMFHTNVVSDVWDEIVHRGGGSGYARPLERSARRKGVTFLLRHEMVRVLRDDGRAGRVRGIVVSNESGDVRVGARRGVVLATGGHTSNVDFRRMFDPRLTNEYQTAGEPWTRQNAAGEIAAIDVGAALWGVSAQASDCEPAVGGGHSIVKTKHIGCQYGYVNLKWDPESPVFEKARASGLTVTDFQDVILVNQVGLRFVDESDESADFMSACLGPNGNLGRNGKANGGGPIWAIFDTDAVEREAWHPYPPHVDPDGWFFGAATLGELASKIVNPHQHISLPTDALDATVARYNGFVDAGLDEDFGKPTPRHKVQRPPFYAAWATPMLHDSVSGLRVDSGQRVLDRRGLPIEGLYCAGESAGGFAVHGLARASVSGRIAGREAAVAAPAD